MTLTPQKNNTDSTYKSPDLSVIIPAYNASDFIDKSLGSVLNSDFDIFRVEIIVVNDGSTDNTQDIVENIQLSHRNIKLINKSNGGLSSARNAGIDVAKGRYILFLDADDFLSPDSLPWLINAAENNQAEIFMFGSRFAHPEDYKKHIVPDFNHVSSVNAINYLRKTQAKALEGAVWRCLFLRDFINSTEIRFNTKIKFSEDNLFMMEILPHCKRMFQTETICHNYVQHGTNMTHVSLRSDWQKKVEMNTSRAEEIYKAYKNNKDLYIRCNLDEVFRYTFQEYAMQAILDAADGCKSLHELKNCIDNVRQLGLYPFDSIYKFKTRQFYTNPIARIKWQLSSNFIGITLISAYSKLCASYKRHKQ